MRVCSRLVVAVAAFASLLSSCVVVPYKPRGEATTSTVESVLPAPDAIIVSAGPREMLDKIAKRLHAEDHGITSVDPQQFTSVAFLDADASLARLLLPETCHRVHEQLGVRFLVLVGEPASSTVDEHGAMLAGPIFLGAMKADEQSTFLASIIDLESARPLTAVRGEADGTTLGVGAFYGLFVVPMTDSAARDALVRGIVQSMRSQAGAGAISIAVLAAEPSPGSPVDAE